VRRILYEGRLVAGVTADDIVPAPAIAEVERDHPRRRFVPTMCAIAGEQLRTQQACDDVVVEQ
jgi:hypothetical protein